MVRVTVPPGCYGLTMPDGRQVNTIGGREYVEVDDRDAATIRGSWYQGSGLLAGVEPYRLGTKATRWCHTCGPGGRRWNAWNHECPRCGTPTSLE